MTSYHLLVFLNSTNSFRWEMWLCSLYRCNYKRESVIKIIGSDLIFDDLLHENISLADMKASDCKGNSNSTTINITQIFSG